MSLIARGLEAEGIATALVSVMPPLSSSARPPRQVIRRLNIGATVGRPHDLEGQRETLKRMISLIENAEGHGAVDKDSKRNE
ncbi:MAG: hypothetical protein OXC84_06235 [Gammaproteobacteria bacterium]|nr:hypothetical protein [Gammaproteobacteria bacterium]